MNGHPPPERRVPPGLTLLLGGARSGKSTFAVELGRAWAGSVTFLATAEPLDDDMTHRIDRHRAERPPWATVEEPLDLDGALGAVAADHLVIVDCLTLWVSNLLLAGVGEEQIAERARAAAEIAAARPAPVVAITNEVGWGIVPANELARVYQDALGRTNQCWAAAAARSLLLVAGRAVQLGDPWTALASDAPR